MQTTNAFKFVPANILYYCMFTVQVRSWLWWLYKIGKKAAKQVSQVRDCISTFGHCPAVFFRNNAHYFKQGVGTSPVVFGLKKMYMFLYFTSEHMMFSNPGLEVFVPKHNNIIRIACIANINAWDWVVQSPCKAKHETDTMNQGDFYNALEWKRTCNLLD